MGKGFIKRFGLTRGALAGAVAHDHHNLVVIGADDRSMVTAARAVGSMRGGLVVAEGDKVLAQLPLSVAGLMLDQPIEAVRGSYDDLLAARRGLSLSKGAGRVASTSSGRVSGDARSASAVPNVAHIQPQRAQRTQRNGRSDANRQPLCVLCDLCG
ncbi:MAG: adenine deaminase C-terminal domain-containing protein [Anaerolineae bacterium]